METPEDMSERSLKRQRPGTLWAEEGRRGWLRAEALRAERRAGRGGELDRNALNVSVQPFGNALYDLLPSQQPSRGSQMRKLKQKE